MISVHGPVDIVVCASDKTEEYEHRGFRLSYRPEISPYIVVMMRQKPHFNNECDCTFLGWYDGMDQYYCPREEDVCVKWSNEPESFVSLSHIDDLMIERAFKEKLSDALLSAQKKYDLIKEDTNG